MNNLILISLLLTSATVFYLSGREWREHVQAGNARLSEEVHLAQHQVAQSRASFEDLRLRLSSRETEVAGARADLNEARAEAAEAIPPEPDPAGEGFWRPDQPYFYLAKRHLGEIGYTTFTADTRLTTAAATLFGMTPQERIAVESAAQRVQSEVAQIEQQRAEQMMAPPEKHTDDHREISFRLRPVEPEIVRSLQARFEGDVMSALGPERGSLLLERTVEPASQWFANQFGSGELTVTLRARREPGGNVHHIFQLEGGRGSMVTRLTFPLAPESPLWRWRHLVGETPLLEERILEPAARQE